MATDRTSRHPIRSTVLSAAIAAALATIALVLVSSSNSAQAASTLVNGNFETGDLSGWAVDTTNGGGASAVPGSTYVYCGEDWICGHRGTIFPKEGSYFALLGSGSQQSEGPSISQPFAASNGDKVSGWAFVNTDWWSGGYKGQVVIKSDSGTTVATPFEEHATIGHANWTNWWMYWEYTFSGLTGAGQFQIEARLQKTGNAEDHTDHSTMGLDDVKLTTTPDNDTTAPSTSVTSGPQGPTNNTAPIFTFSGSDNLTTTANLKYQYRLDSGGWSTPPSTSTTANLSGLSEGAHLFEVRAVDEAGNVDASPAQRSFTVDTTAPDTTITSGPSETTNSTSATFEFSSEAGASFQCKLDTGEFADCESGVTYENLLDGSHTFAVKATDAAGNTDDTPASQTWTVGTTAPTVSAKTPTGKNVPKTTNVTATFSEVMDEGSVEAAGTFTLFRKGSTTKLSATVSYEEGTATLDPTDSLRSGVTYKAVVTTGAKDQAGNPLAQQYRWFFKVSS